MTNYQVDERIRVKKQKVDQAIALAMQNRWDDAVSVNREIVDLYPSDVDAYNRMGRALTELGRYREAREAYRKAVSIDASNIIAQKNLARLSALNTETQTAVARGKVDPRLFIAETGKTGVARLVRVAPRETLAKMAVGDQVYLHSEGRSLYVRNVRGDDLGQVEPKLSQRLIDLMRGGNRYAAAIMSMEDGVRTIIRETYQDPSQSGKLSFPARADGQGIRPYTKDTLVKYEDEEEDDTAEDTEFGLEHEDEEADEPADATEFEEEQNND